MTNRRNLLAFAAFGPALASAAAGKKLANVTIPAAKAQLKKEPFGDLAIYFEGPTDQIGSMTAGSLRLKAGMDPHPPHEHPEEEFLLVTEGEGEIMVDGKTSKVGPGAIMYCAANKSHHIKAGPKGPLMFYFFKWKA